MKSNEKIKQLAEGYWEGCDGCDANDKYFFIKGFEGAYRQCQEDMIELLKEEIRRAYIHGQGNAQMMEAGLERDEVDDYTYSRILSLNKQD
jgi:hypothetical protein